MKVDWESSNNSPENHCLTCLVMCFDRWFELARSLGWFIRSWREEFGADAVVAMQCKPPFGGGCWFRRRCEIGRQTSSSKGCLISVYVHVSLVSLSFCFVSMWFWFSLSPFLTLGHAHAQPEPCRTVFERNNAATSYRPHPKNIPCKDSEWVTQKERKTETKRRYNCNWIRDSSVPQTIQQRSSSSTTTALLKT